MRSTEEKVNVERGGAWHISEMTTTPHDDGPQVAVTDRPLGVQPSTSMLPFAEHICASAFAVCEDNMCCVRQISEVTGESFEYVCDQLDDCERVVYGTNTWRERGASAKMIFEFARFTGRGACCLHGDKVIECLPGTHA